MKIFLCSVVFLLVVINSKSQKASIYAKDPIENLSKKQLFEYLRTKIIAFGEEIKDVKIIEDVCFLVIYYEDGNIIEQHLENLDGNGISWDIFDKSLRLQISSNSSGYADYRTIKDNKDESGPRAFTRCLFNLSRISGEPNFQNNIVLAYKKLIKICGGNPAIK
ncbi:MAG TPA: hypothetical protein PKC72_13370 [Chitinophagaceae bacterium]|nr:hypothetical protein [Chitinophagaceae bacterium]